MDASISDLNWFDILVIFIVFVSTLLAFFKGFIGTVFSFVSWVGALLVTIYSYSHSSTFLAEYIANERVVLTLSLVGVFLFSLIIFFWVSGRCIHLLRKNRWGIVDRTLGFTFGLLRGNLMVCIMYFALSMTSDILSAEGNEEKENDNLPEFITSAATHQLLKIGTATMLTFVPKDVTQSLVNQVETSFDTISDAVANGGIPTEIKQTYRNDSPTDKPDGNDSTLTEEQLKIVDKMMRAVPRDKLEILFQKYRDNSSDITYEQKVKIFREILLLYNKLNKQDKIDKAYKLDPTEMKEITRALFGDKLDSMGSKSSSAAPIEDRQAGTGYKKKNIKQFERLVNNL